jgi:hypothetical protein
MLYERFPNEAAFRTQFILPLLNRLGFREVALTHGQHEFGKDFVFAETTRFGFSKYNAALVKHLENITQGQHAVLEDILRQIKEAFTVPAPLTNPTRDKYMSSVYIFNSGGITEGAKTYLLESLKRGTFGDNVHIFDSASLESANQFAAYGA